MSTIPLKEIYDSIKWVYDNGLNQPNQTAKVQKIEGATDITGTNIKCTNITGTDTAGTTNITGICNLKGTTTINQLNAPAPSAAFHPLVQSHIPHTNGRNYLRGITYLDSNIVINGTLSLNGIRIKTEAWKQVGLGVTIDGNETIVAF